MQRDLHVLELYNDSGPGGAEQMIVDLSRGLRDNGHRVTVGLLCHGWLYDKLQSASIETVVMKKRKRTDVRFVANLAKLVRRANVDLIHAHEFSSNISGCFASRLTGRPVIATVHGKEYVAQRERRRLACRWVGRVSDRMVSVSETIGEFLTEHVGVPSENLQTIHNGIDTKKYDRGDGTALRASLDIDPGAPVIGAVGSLYPVKGHTYLIHAMATLTSQFPSAICLLIGHGELQESLEQEVRSLGLEHNVRFLGYRPDVPKLLEIIDVFVLPSLSEGLPLSLLEAMAAGKPVVATHVGGNREVVQDGVTGFLIEPRRSDLLVDRIATVLSHPERANCMGTRGRSLVQESFGLKRMVHDYEMLFQEVIVQR